MDNWTQYDLKCKAQEVKRVYHYFINVYIKRGNETALKWAQEYEAEHKQLIDRIEDSGWINKYGKLEDYE
jgi:hypothetical protein